MLALRLTTSLCHSVLAEHALLDDLARRPERRRQTYLRDLVTLGLQAGPTTRADYGASQEAACPLRVVLSLNPQIPEDAAALRSLEELAAPPRRSELLRNVLLAGHARIGQPGANARFMTSLDSPLDPTAQTPALTEPAAAASAVVLNTSPAASDVPVLPEADDSMDLEVPERVLRPELLQLFQ